MRNVLRQSNKYITFFFHSLALFCCLLQLIIEDSWYDFKLTMLLLDLYVLQGRSGPSSEEVISAFLSFFAVHNKIPQLFQTVFEIELSASNGVSYFSFLHLLFSLFSFP